MLKERLSKTFKVLGLAAAILPPMAALGSDQAVSAAAVSDQPFYVLCYHRFLRHPDEAQDWAQAQYQMPLEEFKWQMQYLKENGFNPISEEQLMGYWFQGKPLPLKPVLITFDDGFRTIYRDAFPVVKSYGYPSILFLYTKFIEYGESALKKSYESGKKRKVRMGTEALEDADIRFMQKDGMVVESHTASHLNMGLEDEKRGTVDGQKMLEYELNQPLTFIETHFGQKPEWLAYPYGVYDPAVLKTTREAGYKLAFTVNPGPNDRTVPPLMLKRNLILYPISHLKFTEIFKDKVLHLKNLYPADGAVIESQKPVIKALIEDDVVPQTVKLQLGSHLLPAQYDPQTHLFRHEVEAPLAQGGHILTAMATDLKGGTRVYNWYFRIKHKKLEKNAKDDSPNDPIQN